MSDTASSPPELVNEAPATPAVDAGNDTDSSGPVLVEHEDAVLAEAVQIFSIGTATDQYAFTFHESQLACILNGIRGTDTKLAIVSVVGAFRTGKSFVLSWFLRYLTWLEEQQEQQQQADIKDNTTQSNKQEWFHQFESLGNKGFEWKAGSERNTTGIWMWNKPFYVTPTKAVLLVDTQGMFDHETTMALTTCIFGLGCLMSSYMVYNVDKRIQEDNLQHLALFTEYAKMAINVDTETTETTKKQQPQKPFQHVEFLVRDWQNFEDDEESPEQMAAAMDEYLETQVMQGRDAKDLKETRDQIHACFETISCFGLCHPGPAVTKKKYVGSVKDVEPMFLKLLDYYCHRIFTPELPAKIIHGHELNPQEFMTYIKSYAALFQSGANFPEASTMLDATAQANNANAKEEAIRFYKQIMDKVAGIQASTYIKTDRLKQDHVHNVTLALQTFDKRANFGSSQSIQLSRRQVKHALAEQFETYEKLNESRNPLFGMEMYVLVKYHPLSFAVVVVVGQTVSHKPTHPTIVLFLSPFFSRGSYIATLAIVGISWFVKGFLDMTCGHDICVTTSEKFKDFMYAGLCFLAILVLTKFQQLKEASNRISQALQLILQQQQQQPSSSTTTTKPKRE
jgi:atlastin